jgi:hypothetical protein
MFTHGSYVDVEPEERTGRRDSEGGKAYVVHVDGRFDVRYVIGNIFSPNVDVSRIRPTTVQTTARRRQGETGTRPSLLSRQRRLPSSRRLFPEPQQQRRSNSLMTTNELLILSRPWTRGSGAPNPALIYLTKMNAKAEKGWLRKAEADKADRDRDVPTAKKLGQLSTREKQLVLSLKQTLDSVGDTVAAAMASAWGVTSKTVRRIQNQSLKVDGLAAPRKERFDKGDTVFTSDAKRKQVYTPLYVFKKLMRTANRGEELMEKELNDLWEVATPATKLDAENRAIQLVLRGPYLVAEVTKALLDTRGRITWYELRWRSLEARRGRQRNRSSVC